MTAGLLTFLGAAGTVTGAPEFSAHADSDELISWIRHRTAGSRLRRPR